MKDELLHATGRRKSSVARVWMKPGKGKVTINKREMDGYFMRKTSEMIVMQPLELTGNADKFDININVVGGGLVGQAGAIRHGISRVLSELDPEYRKVLKASGLVRRDDRIKERKLYGQKGARARYQFSKR